MLAQGHPSLASTTNYSIIGFKEYTYTSVVFLFEFFKNHQFQFFKYSSLREPVKIQQRFFLINYKMCTSGNRITLGYAFIVFLCYFDEENRSHSFSVTCTPHFWQTWIFPT
jgi:hypothetical protein